MIMLVYGANINKISGIAPYPQIEYFCRVTMEKGKDCVLFAVLVVGTMLSGVFEDKNLFLLCKNLE